jgi:hypothetical protein
VPKRPLAVLEEQLAVVERLAVLAEQLPHQLACQQAQRLEEIQVVRQAQRPLEVPLRQLLQNVSILLLLLSPGLLRVLAPR